LFTLKESLFPKIVKHAQEEKLKTWRKLTESVGGIDVPPQKTLAEGVISRSRTGSDE